MNSKIINAADVKAAIERSISHNEIEKLEVLWPASTEEEEGGLGLYKTAEEVILDILNELETEDSDVQLENDGNYDVWGTFNGQDFRIRIINAD